MKHTPPPWKICEHCWSDTSIQTNDGILICKLSIYDDATEETQQELEMEMDANAKLIAAAPYLLLALESLIDMPPLSRDDEIEIWNTARAAIAKAKGTKP